MAAPLKAAPVMSASCWLMTSADGMHVPWFKRRVMCGRPGMAGKSPLILPRNLPVHDVAPGIRTFPRERILVEEHLRGRFDAGSLIGLGDRLVDQRLESGVLAQHAQHMLALDRNARLPTARAPRRLVIPLQQVQKDDAQR